VTRLTIMTVEGDTDALLARAAEMDAEMKPLALKYGALARVVARHDRGVIIVNLWRSAEGSEAMAADPAVRSILERAGVGAGRTVEHYEVEHYDLEGATTAAS